MAVVKNQILRVLLFSLGVTSVVLGVIGVFLPLLPTTPFILLAAWAFLKSSKSAHDWLARQPVFGEALKNWERNRSISRKTKLISIGTIFVSIAWIWIVVDFVWIATSVTAFLIFISAFIWTRNE